MEHAGITLSIIIPVYNVMAYLRPCLDGLLNSSKGRDVFYSCPLKIRTSRQMM